MGEATPAVLTSIAPFFIVRDVTPSIAFYRDLLGFEVTFVTPDENPFFAILARDGARIMVKAILPEVLPLPNHARHPWAKWDAFVATPDPDALATELTARGVTFQTPLANTDDQLRGFELQDPDGYVLFFGRSL
jgi:catechol 2,3-dioxygenase-like lactoylglutathione lyase family enzyme